MTYSVSGGMPLPNAGQPAASPANTLPIVAGGTTPQARSLSLVDDALIAVLGTAAPVTGGGAPATAPADPYAGFPDFVRAYLPGGSAAAGYAQQALPADIETSIWNEVPTKKETGPPMKGGYPPVSNPNSGFSMPGYAPGFNGAQQGIQQGYTFVRCWPDMRPPMKTPNDPGQMPPPPPGKGDMPPPPGKGDMPPPPPGKGDMPPPPGKGDMPPSKQETLPAKDATPPPVQQGPPAKTDGPCPIDPSQESQGTYVVQKGDNLSKIAKGYGLTWQQLYWENKDQIKHPDLIYPGQTFNVPPKCLEVPPFGYTPRHRTPPPKGTPSHTPPTKGPSDPTPPTKTPEGPPAKTPEAPPVPTPEAPPKSSEPGDKPGDKPPTDVPTPETPAENPAPPASEPGQDATNPSAPPVPGSSELPPAPPK